MKIHFTLILVGLLGAAKLFAAEPTPRTCVEETFFGSSPTSYAIIRTETESLEDGVQTRLRTWLDEYAKEPVLIYDFKTETERIRNGAYTGKLERSFLLLDDPGDPPPSGEAVAAKIGANERLEQPEVAPTLAALLRRYSQRTLIPWPSEQTDELKQTDDGLFITYKTQTLVSGQSIRARMGGLRMGDAELLEMLGHPTMDSVAEDGNCAFVTLSAATEKHKQTRVFCLIPMITRNLHVLVSRQSMYLSAGKFDTREEALRVAGELRGKLNGESGFAGSTIEVWAQERMSYSRTFYFVVVTDTMEVIRKRQVETLEKLLGSRLLLVKSDSFSVLIDGPSAIPEP